MEIFSSYKQAGRSEIEIAWMVARDFMLISKQLTPQRHVHDPSESNLCNVNATSYCASDCSEYCAPNNGRDPSPLNSGASALLNNGGCSYGVPSMDNNLYGSQQSYTSLYDQPSFSNQQHQFANQKDHDMNLLASLEPTPISALLSNDAKLRFGSL
jgi:hypothetical protein